MADQADIIRRTRRQVADYKDPIRYEDPYYKDAIQFGLEKLSFDFGESYTDVPSVPAARVFLLVKLAIIQMAYIRAGEGAEGESGEGDAARYTSITVPDLSVSGDAAAKGANYWLQLARDLQTEYDGEVGDDKAGQNLGGEVTQHLTHRISKVHGGYAKRRLDPGLPAVTLAAVVDGNDVDLSWDRVFREDLQTYDVERSTGPNFDADTEDVLRVASVWDAVQTEYTDEGLAAGTWYYRVQTVNPNHIKTPSNLVTVVVP